MSLSADTYRRLATALGLEGAANEITAILNGTQTVATTFSGGLVVTTADVTITDVDIALSATTGTKFPKLATQKLGFFGATPIVQPANTVDYVTMLTNLGLRGTGGTATATFPGILSAVGMVNTGTDTLSVGGSTAAAGSTNADATGLPAGTATVYPTTGATDATGVILDTADKVTGRTLLIGNGVSNKILKVYPPSGGTINGASANVAFSSVSGKGVIITCLSGAGNTWLAW